jgi:hypothetical protein
VNDEVDHAPVAVEAIEIVRDEAGEPAEVVVIGRGAEEGVVGDRIARPGHPTEIPLI